MSASYASHYSTRTTSQSEPIPGKAMARNAAGGFAFPVDDWTRLDRFLVLGAEGGSYYATERQLTIENAQAVGRCIAQDGARTVLRVVEISEAGRAPKNDPAVFALAMAAGLGSPETRRLALDALPRVARIPTALFAFHEAVKGFRGRGRALKRALAHWYTDKDPRSLSYAVTKYQQRNSWSHRDLLRLCKPRIPEDADERLRLVGKVFSWVVGKQGDGWTPPEPELAPIAAFELAKKATTKAEIVRLIREHDLVRECIPTQWLTEPDVWEALLDKMPLTAMVRNLATMTRVGLLAPLSAAVGKVTSELANLERLKKSRLHPVALLVALKTYAAGHGEKSKHTWSPVPQVVDALDGAFYAAFGNVEPTNKRWLLALDVSGSMGSSMVAGIPNLSAREGACALALVTAATERSHAIVGFTGRGFSTGTRGPWGISGVEPLNLSPRQRLDDACRAVAGLPMGPTDCALPMQYALAERLAVDAFFVATDNETWHGDVHPCQALQQYRERTGIPAKLVVVGMTSGGFSIADPNDAGMLDVVGMDVAVPQVVADFARG